MDFSYSGEGGNLSLKDVNLHIKSGQIVGVIGGTGSAKSTLVQLIPRLYDVTGGCVKVGGVDVRKYNLKALRDQVSMVLQKNVLFTGSIYENISAGVMRTPATRKCRESVSWRRPTALSRSSRASMTP